MDHWQRVFAYTTGSIVIGLMLIVFTNNFLSYINAEGNTGYIALLAYGFVFLNLGYGINRRFSLKANRAPAINYTLSLLTTAPTLLWIYTKDEGLGDSIITFTITILFSVLLGTYFGIKKGNTRRSDYLQQVKEEMQESTPEELKRSHDDLSKN
ncbi:MAG: hypothetical protein U5J95_08400 [Balneolaceae bacterium]|nr:hypothetical protein [Balneolaceae bacterium]